MPELPEVQVTVDALNVAGIKGVRIERIEVSWLRSIATPTVNEFCRLMVGSQIEAIDRRGKFIIFRLKDKHWLVAHLRMTGRFLVTDRAANQINAVGDAFSKHVHVVIEFENGRSLLFHDTRKFGRFYLVQDLSTVTGSLGVEPLSRAFSAACLSRELRSRNRAVKPLLLDQKIVAGLGNIYTDEALWRAGVHPLRRSADLDDAEIYALRNAIRHVLRQGIANQGTTLGKGKHNFAAPGDRRGHNIVNLKVFRRTGQPCPRCGEPIERLIVAQRSSHVCTRCQPLL